MSNPPTHGGLRSLRSRRACPRPAASLGLILFVAGACQGSAPPEETGDAASAQDGMATPSEGATRLFTLSDPELLPENVAHDPRTGAYYVGSTRRGSVVRWQAGQSSTFVSPRAHGLWMVIGMKVDSERGVLWACSSDGGNLIGGPEGSGAAGLFRFDLETGDLLDRWVLDTTEEAHFLNDLALDAQGNAWVTHMFDRPGLYRAAPGGAFELWMDLPEDSWPNGIAVDPSGSHAFVALSEGVARVDLAGRTLAMVEAPVEVPTTGIDGLYLHESGLVAVRPGASEVRRYGLAPDGRAIVSTEVLAADHADHAGPTTGVLVGNTLVYVANAQFERFETSGVQDLVDPVILRVPLR